jgi:hypothetical protein
MICECQWKNCVHKNREVAADHGECETSPQLCWQCLFVCCGEEDDELDQIGISDDV